MQSFVFRGKAILMVQSAGKSSMWEIYLTVPQTATGELDENSKVYELILLKEFGKFAP